MRDDFTRHFPESARATPRTDLSVEGERTADAAHAFSKGTAIDAETLDLAGIQIARSQLTIRRAMLSRRPPCAQRLLEIEALGRRLAELDDEETTLDRRAPRS